MSRPDTALRIGDTALQRSRKSSLIAVTTAFSFPYSSICHSLLPRRRSSPNHTLTPNILHLPQWIRTTRNSMACHSLLFPTLPLLISFLTGTPTPTYTAPQMTTPPPMTYQQQPPQHDYYKAPVVHEQPLRPDLQQQHSSMYRQAVAIPNLNMSSAPVDCPSCAHRRMTTLSYHAGNTTQ